MADDFDKFVPKTDGEPLPDTVSKENPLKMGIVLSLIHI